MARKSLKQNVSRSSFWGICCESGKKYTQVVTHRFHISMAALDPTVMSTSPCVSVMVERGGSQYLLCNLVPKTILQANLDLYFEKGERVTFSIKGVGTVHLSGYHIYDENDSQPNSNSNLKFQTTADNSSTDKKITVVKKQPESLFAKKKKETSSEETSSEDETTHQKQQPPKKRTIETLSDDSDEDDDDFVLDYDDEDDSEDDDDGDEEDEDDDSDTSSEESEDIKTVKPKKMVKEFQNKKLKTNASTPLQVKNDSNKVKKTPEANLKTWKNAEPDEMNSSIGKTPMPKKTASMLQHSKSNDSSIKMNISSESDKNKSSDPLNTTDAQSSAKKKKKKKKKSLAQSGAPEPSPSKLSDTNKTPSKANESMKSTPQYGKKLPGGIEFDDIRVGNGPPAMKGKLVHVYYTGKLDNDKVFDSCTAGSKAFSFKLGTGQVIKGWDLGLEGMKVGGKRRLKIPAHMAYGNTRTGPIPPNSTLHFTVELKGVS